MSQNNQNNNNYKPSQNPTPPKSTPKPPMSELIRMAKTATPSRVHDQKSCVLMSEPPIRKTNNNK
jgi:hypothetical protein